MAQLPGHPEGCKCTACALDFHPAGCRCPRCTPNFPPSDPYPIVTMYMVGTPDGWRPRPKGNVTTPDIKINPPEITITTRPPDPVETKLAEISEQIRELAKTQDGMRKLVERALKKGAAK